MSEYIEVSHICKDFEISKTQPGVMGAVKSLFHREYELRHAVKDISFSIGKGEMVGYIGPNGAGKSTTIKMLSGILTPTSGTATVNGIVPYQNRKENAKQIGVVFGQRSQLLWDLPVRDTFDLYQKLYNIENSRFENNKNLFIELLQMQEFLDQPVRQLSLGQKMKANLAIAMLHDPAVLYLDEPTIGLDVMSKQALRESIKQMNQEKKTTIVLTTHDMGDIEAVCQRLILIDHGQKLFDGKLSEFKEQYEDGFAVRLEFEGKAPDWEEDGQFVCKEWDEHAMTVQAPSNMPLKDALLLLIQKYEPSNISVKEQNIEEIVTKIFREK